MHVVTGTSGLTADDFAEIDAAARSAGVGAVAAGNFSLTAAMAQAAALLAARFLPQREIVDYASATKRDAPSGTARELAERLAGVATHPLAVPLADVVGHPEARGSVRRRHAGALAAPAQLRRLHRDRVRGSRTSGW